MRHWVALAALLIAAVSSLSCGDSDSRPPERLAGSSLSVGSKEFTEQLILGQMTVILLENAGVSVENKLGISGTKTVRAALEVGAIDMYWEYTGSGWAVHFDRNVADAPSSPDDLHRQVAAEDKADNGVVWLDAAPLNNTYAVAVAAGRDSQLGVKTLTEYAALANTRPELATLCGATEWLTRLDGLPGLEATYGFDVPNSSLAEVDLALIYELVPTGEVCNFGEVFATDGRIISNDLVLLEDDRNFFLAYQPALTVREDVYEVYGTELEAIFNPVAAQLTISVMQQLNAEVDVAGQDPAEVARRFLEENGFIE